MSCTRRDAGTARDSRPAPHAGSRPQRRSSRPCRHATARAAPGRTARDPGARRAGAGPAARTRRRPAARLRAASCHAARRWSRRSSRRLVSSSACVASQRGDARRAGRRRASPRRRFRRVAPAATLAAAAHSAERTWRRRLMRGAPDVDAHGRRWTMAGGLDRIHLVGDQRLDGVRVGDVVGVHLAHCGRARPGVLERDLRRDDERVFARPRGIELVNERGRQRGGLRAVVRQRPPHAAAGSDDGQAAHDQEAAARRRGWGSGPCGKGRSSMAQPVSQSRYPDQRDTTK